MQPRLPRSVCSCTTLGNTFAATCSIESAGRLACWDSAVAAVAMVLITGTCGYTARAATPPIPADTTATASPAANKTARENACAASDVARRAYRSQAELGLLAWREVAGEASASAGWSYRRHCGREGAHSFQTPVLWCPLSLALTPIAACCQRQIRHTRQLQQRRPGNGRATDPRDHRRSEKRMSRLRR